MRLLSQEIADSNDRIVVNTGKSANELSTINARGVKPIIGNI